MKMLLILTLFLTVQNAIAQTVDVSSSYNGVIQEGGGVIIGLGNRRFIFTASHLSQGSNLDIKVNHRPISAQIKGRLSYNEYDFEMFEVPLELAPKTHAEWDPQRQEFFSTYNYSEDAKIKDRPFKANPFVNLTPCIVPATNADIILVFNSKNDFSGRYGGNFEKEQVQRLPIVICPRSLIVSDITKQLILDTALFPGSSGNPVYKKISPQDNRDTLLGLASATDSLTFRSYYVDRSIIKHVFKSYLSGANGALGYAQWIMGTTEPYELYRTFGGPVLVSEIEGKMLRSSTGRANRGQTGRANRGQTGKANRGQTGDLGITSNEFVFDYDVLAEGQGLILGGRRALGFKYNGINLEANLASYYWLQGKAYEVIWHDEPDQRKALSINYINAGNGELRIKNVGTKSFSADLILQIIRKGNFLIIFDRHSQGGVQIDMTIAKLKDILFIPFTFLGQKYRVDLRSLFLLDISENNYNFDINQAKKSRIVRFLRSQTKDIDDFFRTFSFYVEEP